MWPKEMKEKKKNPKTIDESGGQIISLKKGAAGVLKGHAALC